MICANFAGPFFFNFRTNGKDRRTATITGDAVYFETIELARTEDQIMLTQLGSDSDPRITDLVKFILLNVKKSYLARAKPMTPEQLQVMEELFQQFVCASTQNPSPDDAR